MPNLDAPPTAAALAAGSSLLACLLGGSVCSQTLVAPLSASNTANVETRATTNRQGQSGVRLLGDAGWLEFELAALVCGRYRCEIALQDAPASGAVLWVEDYVGNSDGRRYDITAPIVAAGGAGVVHKVGSPLDAGTHRMRLHYEGGPITLRQLSFTMVRKHERTPTCLVQSTDGDSWALVWADEFDGTGLPDPAKWTADIGNWGWGNRELQYYTEGRTENARQEGGHLVIEARAGDMQQPWTSARLTTRGKVSFLYGRIEIRAKVPVDDGTWAAGWLLGDAYRDERSWPYCGEIDLLEGVGREIDDRTGDGVNHASCHTRAYYFKQGNHITSTRPVQGMGTDFHEYSVEWLPDKVTVAIDGQSYYVYDKTNGPLEWPFDKPQNLILNLAIGGGMGGTVAPSTQRPRYVVDYVRVYGRR